MNGFTPNTKSERVVKELRHAIQTGGMESGSMLKSVRTLASEFSVSTMIVQRALDMLEAEKLIWREQGRGVFVKDFRKGRTVEVAMLGVLPDDKNSYAQRVAGILHYPNCREGYNFTLRSITRKELSSTGFLFQEYRKIVNFLNPDCLLIHSVHLKREAVEEILSLPVPVIFIGQFASDDSDDLDFSQIRHLPESANCSAVSAMLNDQPFREFVFLTGSLHYTFNRKGLEGARRAAAEYNANMHVIELPKSFSDLEKKEQKNALRSIHRRLNAMDGLPVFCAGHVPFLERLPEDDFGKHDFYAGKCLSDSDRVFYDVIYNEINHLIRHPSEHHKIMLDDICEYEKITQKNRGEKQ